MPGWGMLWGLQCCHGGTGGMPCAQGLCGQETGQQPSLQEAKGVWFLLKCKFTRHGKMRFSKTFQMAVSGRYSHGGHCFFPTPCPHFFLALPNFRVPSPDHGMEEQNREHKKISLAYLKHCIFPTPGILPDFFFLTILYGFLRKCSHATRHSFATKTLATFNQKWKRSRNLCCSFY